ncbi:hypothetical protein [Pseudanabaena sp. FACHB-2040]|uniref:hypothetical protein n=1 Tax=Pseudanabaena sp. FACHB-2040 TaxID=2692859 RepID=UPI00168A3937|nr:hypothetical protein [Pseudanabaena sp. FACHB-2040]MBD0267468.1 hypothetical protein [Cyanobacteria bacterium Co-bin8]MBD2260414.1 hypothetical protein [Pseudanabaena sp. FACHB-2040]
MIVTFSVDITTRLIAIARRHHLIVPIPLSTPFQSYASTEELGLIQAALQPLALQCEEVAAILAQLEDCLQPSAKLPQPAVPALA